jgi:hypothetical protein
MFERTTRALLEAIVRQKCAAGESFTAYDITCAARHQGGAGRHRHLKHVVHEAFFRGTMGPEYERRLVQIPGAPAPAWQYYRCHPAAADGDTRPQYALPTLPYSVMQEQEPVRHQPRVSLVARLLHHTITVQWRRT